MGAFEDKYGIPAPDAPSFEQKYGLADEAVPAPAPANLGAIDTASTMSRAMDQGATELSRAGFGRGGRAPTDEAMRSSRESPTRIIPATKAIGTVTGEQFTQMIEGAKAMWKEGRAADFRKRGPLFDPLDFSSQDLPPTDRELALGGKMSEKLKESAKENIREANLASERAAAAIPADATDFEKNIIQGVGSGLASAAVVIPGALAAPATGGASLPLAVGLMGAGAAGARYAELRGQNVDEAAARESAELLGALESLTEFIPGSTLVKRSPIGKQVVEFMLTDLLGENISTAAQLTDDYRLQLRDDITLDDFKSAIADTTVQTLVGGATQLSINRVLQESVDAANAKAEARDRGEATDQARADANRGAGIPTADEMVANLDATDAQFEHPQLPPPAASGGGFRVDSQGNARVETEGDAFHVEQAANAREEARARIEKRIQADVDRASSVKRLPAPDTSSADLIVAPSGEARRQTQNEANAANLERARQRDMGISPTRVPLEDADAQMRDALAAAKDGKATAAQTKAILDEKLGKRNTGGTLILLPAGRRKLKTLSEGTGKERGNATSQTDLPAVVAGTAPAARPADGAAGAAGTSREDAALEHHDPRLKDADRMEAIQRLRGDIGAWERGGRLMRADGEQGEVTGRTTHIASDLWKNRPTNESGAQISTEKAIEALDRMQAGKPLSPSQQKYVTYLLDEQDTIAAEWKAFQEKEAPRHEAEIVEVIPEFKAQPDDAQTITALAKVAAQYASEEELEAALEAQDDGEAMRRLQRLVDRGWIQPQDEAGETSVTTEEKELAGDAEAGAGQSRAPEESRQAEVPNPEAGLTAAEKSAVPSPARKGAAASAPPKAETDLLGNDVGATKALNKQQSKVDKKLGKGKAAPKPEDAPAGDIFRAQADKEDAENAAKQTDLARPKIDFKPLRERAEEEHGSDRDDRNIGGALDEAIDELEMHDTDGTLPPEARKILEELDPTDDADELMAKLDEAVSHIDREDKAKAKKAAAPPREKVDPTAVPDDAREPKDSLGNRQFEEHSGIKLGDRVTAGDKHVGHVRRIFEVLGKTSKMGKKRTSTTAVRAEVHWPTKSPGSEGGDKFEGGSDQNVDIDKLKVFTGSEVETAAAGAKGMARKRLDKAIGKYLQAKRPAFATEGKERERIVSYRTEALVGLNKASGDGADDSIIEFLENEYGWAVETLTKVYPGINWETLEREEPKKSTSTEGATAEETEEIGAAFDAAQASEGEEDEQVTHVFDPPAKTDIVRLNDKSKVYHKDHGWMTVDEAKARIAEWKAHATAQGKTNANADKVVLSLFDLTGAWSQPWEDAGYNVWRFDIQNDAEMGDVNKFSTEFFNDWFGDFDGQDIYAVLAACPCTDFAVSGARHFAAKDADGRTHSSVELVHQTMRVIEYFKPAVWALENPVGRIESLTGLPPWRLSFDPNHLGDPYTKKTLIWGRFNADLPVAPVEPTEGSKMHKLYGGKSQKTKNARSATPEGFSYGFFMANNAIDHPEMAVHGKFDRLDRPTIAAALKRGVTVEQITEAVEDFYYQDLDDKSANAAIAALQPKKAEEPKAVPPKAAKKKAVGGKGYFDKAVIDDAGEKIGGARKDQWKDRGLSLDDLESMTDSEAATIVKKQAVWKPDYEKLIEAGASPKAAALIKVVYDKLGATPRANTPEGRKHYVEMMRAVRDNYESAKTDKDVEDAARKIHDAAGLTPELARMTYNNPERLAAVTKLFSVMKGRSSVFSIGYTEKRAADKLIEKGFPNAQPWTSRFNIRERSTSGITPAGVASFMKEAESLGTPFASEEILRKGSFFVVTAKGTGRTIGFSHTKDGAEALAQKAYGDVKSKKADGELPERPHLDTLKRTGPERRKTDITPDDFIAAFGFRGVEFGNWAANDERQKLLNLSFDALHDLAEIVGIPANAISLNGTLGLALAARGSGKALAHYEPGKLVINMTKLRGAGTLAHEWAHALDHYFGELERPDAYKTQARGATGWYKWPGAKHNENLRAEMQGAWRRVRTAIKHNPAGTNDSDFYKQAKRLSGKSGADGYWARPTELFARAFESFVFDKIKALGRESDYLVHAVEADRYASDKYKGNPYPTGEERVAINKAMETLVAGFEVVPQPDDVAMIREDEASYGKVQERQVVKSAKGQLTFDLFTPDPKLPVARRIHKALAATALVQTGRLQTGIQEVHAWTDVAHIVAPIRKSPQERFVAVVLNKKGKVLSVLMHTKGVIDGAMAEPWSMLGSIARIEGASKVYLAHNHPSGGIEQSMADHLITNNLSALVENTGISIEGMIVVAPGNKRASFYLPFQNNDQMMSVPAHARVLGVPLQERVLTRVAHIPTKGFGLQSGFRVMSSETGNDAVRMAVADGVKSGILGIDNKGKVIDVIDVPLDEMRKLRAGNVQEGALRILQRIESANVKYHIVFAPRESGSGEATNNLSSMLTGAGLHIYDLKFYDTDGPGVHSSAPEMRSTWYAKGPPEGTRMTKGAVESAIEPVLLNVNDMGIDVIVAATPYHLPKDLYDSLYDEGALDQVKGIFVQDADGPVIHLIASNIRDQWHAREIVIHELAHYGIHNILGADEYARVMDDLWKRFPDIVKAAGRRNNIDMSGPTGQRTAAEEAVAYASARLVDGETLEVPERSFLKRVFDAIRNALAKLWPKFAVADRELADILRNAMASLTVAQKQRAPEERIFRKAESVDEPPKGEPVGLTTQNKLHLDINQTGRHWFKARVPTAWLMPQKPAHDFFQKKTAEEIQKFTDANPPLLEWIPGENGGFFDVVDGNHRVAAAKAAGIKEITVKYSIRPKGYTNLSWLYSREAPPFYSALVRAAQDAKTQKASGAQWLATLRNTPGIKEEEIQWTGLEEWLQRQTSNADHFLRDLISEGGMLSPAQRAAIKANPGIAGNTITKQQVVDFLAANQITVTESLRGGGHTGEMRQKIDRMVVELTALGYTPYIEASDYGGSRIEYIVENKTGRSFYPEKAGWEYQDDQDQFIPLENKAAVEKAHALDIVLKDAGDVDESEDGTRHSDWQTPGGENYREMLLTLPNQPFSAEALRKRKDIFERHQPAIDAARARYDAASDSLELHRSGGSFTDAEMRRDWEANEAAPERKPYRSHHWDEPNVLAHVRFNERTDADGKRVLFIQEIQSDWHQAGRKRGYQGEVDATGWTAELDDGVLKYWNVSDAQGNPVQKGIRAPNAAEAIASAKHYRETSGVPNAPFKTTWPELAFKRMVRWASEHGFERIAWATGEMNTDVFGLDRQVEYIDVTRNPNGTYLIEAKTTGMDVEDLARDVAAKDLAEFVGESLAKKIVAQADGLQTYRGDHLKIGGEGMKGFYDKMLPQIAAKIGKKWGAKVGRTNISDRAHGEVFSFKPQDASIQKVPNGPFQVWANGQFKSQFDTKEKAEAFAATGGMVPVHSMDVTSAMRDAAMVGQPLFSRRWSANATGRGNAIRNGRPAFDLPEGSPWSSWWNYIVYQMQNKFYDLFRTQKELAAYRSMVNLPEAEDANLKQTLYHGRAEKRIDDFMEEFVENKRNPAARTLAKLVKSAQEKGYPWQVVEDWLYARHAKEANAHLLKINDGDPRFNSGMSDAEADTILTSYQDPVFDEIGALVDSITKWTRDNLIAEGLEDPATVAAWEATYKHYVPLKGWKDDPDLAEMPRVGKGFDTGGKTKARTGRTSRGDAILANLVAAAQASIIRGEKAKVGRALYEMVKNTDAPALWSVDEVEYVRYVDPRDGLVREVINPSYVLAPNVIRVRIGGKDYHITFNPQNESMLRLAEAFKNLSNEKVGKIAAVFLGINRYLSTMNTTLTPEFVITNALRDIQTALISIGTNDIAGLRAKMLGNWKNAARGIWNKERGDGTHPWAALWDEFQNEGGKVGWLDHYKSAVDLEKKLQGLVEPDGTIKMTAKGVGAALKLVEDMNMSVENAIRLAAYQAAKDSGVSKARSAEIAKNLTVNFNRKGNMGTAMNAAYLFYNAAVQGTSVVWGTVKHPKTRKLVYLLVAAGIAMDIVNRMIGDTDPDKEKRYDKISEHDKESNMILMLPPGMRFHMPSGDEVSYLKVPLPYGFNTFYYAGTKIGGIVDHVAIGNKRVVKPMEDATLIGTAFFNAFSPVGGQSGSPIQAIAPTVMDPFVQIWENKNWTGNPIMPVDRPFENPLPDSERYFKSATQPARDMVHWLNSVSGGTEISPGGVDISPETVDHFWDFALGGLGRFASGTMNTAHDVIVKPEDLSLREVPFLRRIAGEIGNRYIQDKFYEHVAEVGYAHDEWEKALDMKKGSPDFLEQQAYVRDRYPVAVEMINDLKSTTRVIRKARKETTRLEERKGKMLEEKRSKGLEREKDFIQQEMEQFNKRWNEVEDSKMGERQKGRDITSSVGSLVDGKSKREAVASLREAGLPATAALLWELPMSSSKAITEWFERDSARA